MPGCRDQGRKDGVSDPGARAGNGPARVRRGRLRHRCRCLVSVVCASVVGLEITANQVHMCARNGAQISGQPGPARPRSSGPRTALVPRAMTQRMHRAIVRRVRVRDGRRCGIRWSRRPSRMRCSICARHRARLSASLRPRIRPPQRAQNARRGPRGARPADLDGACAQIRPGPYVMVGGMTRRNWTDLRR
jgi:hypothetical protein